MPDNEIKEHATIVVETGWSPSGGFTNAVRVIPHKLDGEKPRGKAGRGFYIAMEPGSTKAEALRFAAEVLDGCDDDFSHFISVAKGETESLPDQDGGDE